MTETIFQIFGGLALFLLAMEMMTNGLKSAAGQHLRHMLGHWTRTPLRGFGAGVLITGIVQSSSAVTVATIGFVNAGLLSLSHSLSVVFGANVGTTMTGWLVSLVGFGFRIEAFAMPLLAAGVAMKLLSRGQRNQSLGEALAGFALFFLGLSVLKDSLDQLTVGLGSSDFLGQGLILPLFVLFGFLATVLTQSSSAALAIILSAAASNLLSLQDAAAAVIGANLGTTSTAAIAVLKATANARRLAVGHVIFNLVTGAIAILILPLMLWLVASVTDWLDLETNVAMSLALFHTLFNLLGAAIMLPLLKPFARILGRMFRSREEDNAEPRFLDDTLINTPELAVGAVGQEMKRLFGLTRGLLRVCLDQEDLTPEQIRARSEAALSLNSAITEYISRLRAEKMLPATVDSLTLSIRTCRYLAEATSLAPALLKLRQSGKIAQLAPLKGEMNAYTELLRDLVRSEAQLPETFGETEKVYHALKSRVLAMIVTRELPVPIGERTLDNLSSARRLCDQWNKSLDWRTSTESNLNNTGSI
jgi:phosphate:Na+ symporter